MADRNQSEAPGEPVDPDVRPDERVMGFLDHLEELRWTIVKSLVVFLAGFIVIAIFLADAANVLNWPLHRALADNPDALRLVTTTPLAIFSVFVMICFLGATTMALPFVLYFVGQFVAPALTIKEKRLLLPACFAAVVLFLAGGLFSYFLLVPSVIRVSAYFNTALGYQLLWSADRYYSMLVWMVLGMGAAFQFPMILQILIYLGLLSVEKLRKWRRYAILAFFLIAAVITPTPDPFNQALVALPLWLLYEVAIWVGAIYTSRIAVQSGAASDAGDAEST